jgi:signal peptidase I
VSQPKGFWRENLETILVCVIFVLFARTFVFQQSKIPTGSMEDTLLVGDYILVNRFQYAPTRFGWERALLPARKVRRGDVVVFKFPAKPETDYIKRVIGLPGDVVEIRGGQVLVNARPRPEPYTFFKGGNAIRSYGPRTVPPGQYFVMGDNRDRSEDSRSWGFVPRSHLQGRAILIWWSYEEDRDDYLRTRFAERARSIASKVIHFFNRTRWNRFFNLIH